jgi:hypothetical protein
MHRTRIQEEATKDLLHFLDVAGSISDWGTLQARVALRVSANVAQRAIHIAEYMGGEVSSLEGEGYE